MKRTIPTVWGIIIIILVALLVYFVWQGSFWKQVAEGKKPMPGKELTGVEVPEEVLEPSAMPQPEAPMVGKPGPTGQPPAKATGPGGMPMPGGMPPRSMPPAPR